MSWIYVLSGTARARDLRLSGRRPALSGEILMTANGYLQLVFYVVVLIALAKPLGAYMARIYEGQPAVLNRIGAPFERLIYRAVRRRTRRRKCAGRSTPSRRSWFNLLGVLAVYALQRLQALPAAQPAEHGRGVARFVVQHRDQLRHQHQLAGLRRRVAP